MAGAPADSTAARAVRPTSEDLSICRRFRAPGRGPARAAPTEGHGSTGTRGGARVRTVAAAARHVNAELATPPASTLFRPQRSDWIETQHAERRDHARREGYRQQRH